MCLYKHAFYMAAKGGNSLCLPSDGYLSSGDADIQYMVKLYVQPQSAQTAFSQPNILKYLKSKLQKG